MCTEDDYFVNCDHCEIRVDLTEHDHKRIIGQLAYDKRSSGNRGRCLVAPLPELGLLAGDRLEPSIIVTDVGDGLNEHIELPLSCVFWWRSSETFVRHRNPLFDRSTGITMKCHH